jgi:hypothetical protein
VGESRGCGAWEWETACERVSRRNHLELLLHGRHGRHTAMKKLRIVILGFGTS